MLKKVRRAAANLMCNSSNEFVYVVGYDENEQPIYQNLTWEDLERMFPEDTDCVTAEDIYLKLVWEGGVI